MLEGATEPDHVGVKIGGLADRSSERPKKKKKKKGGEVVPDWDGGKLEERGRQVYEDGQCRTASTDSRGRKGGEERHCAGLSRNDGG